MSASVHLSAAVTKKQIEDLDEAAACAGDTETTAWCAAALEGDAVALKMVSAIIARTAAEDETLAGERRASADASGTGEVQS